MHLLYLQQLLVLPQAAGNDRCWQFARQWVAAGHQVTFVSTTAALPADHPWRQAAAYPAWFEVGGIHVCLFDIAYSHQMRFRRRIRAFAAYAWQVLRRDWCGGGYDAVLAYTAPLSVAEAGRRLARRLGLPLFVEVADVWPAVPIGMGIIRHPLLAGWLQGVARKVYAAARQIFPYSEGMYAQLLAAGVPPGRLCTIPNGADLEAFVPQARPAGPVTRFIYAGTLGIANDLGQLMQAVALLGGRRDVRFDIVGEGNDAARVRQLARDLGLEQVHFWGQVPRGQVAALLAQADVGIVCFAPFPVLEANAATKFFDYLAAGLPLLINYEGWQADYLRRYQCGLSAPQGDAAALAEAICRLADDPALRTTCAINGRRLAEAQFDRRVLARQMLERILALL
ncbi:MAG: glycosyltransferase family 4 protein [Bacteroidia bacterium]